MRFLGDLEGGTNAGNRPDCKVGRETKGLTNVAIALALHQDLVGAMNSPTYHSNVITGVGKSFERGVDLGRLLGGRVQFQDDRAGGHHVPDCTHANVTYKGAG